MEKLPTLNNLSHAKKDELIISLWEENQKSRGENKILSGKISGNVEPNEQKLK